MPFKIAVDKDSVLAELVKPWLKDYNPRYKDNLKFTDITGWNIHQFVKPECGGKILEFAMKEEVHKNLKVIRGAKKILKKLRRERHDLVIVSSLLSPQAQSGTLYWLHKHFPDISNICFISAKTTKNIVQADILIDDGTHNITRWAKARRKAIVFDRPWNQDVETNDRIFRAKDWNEVYAIIKKLNNGGK